jgi:hypothetical protein
MTRRLQSFSDKDGPFSVVSSLAVGLLHPVMARRLFPASVLGLLSYELPPEESPEDKRSMFLALEL